MRQAVRAAIALCALVAFVAVPVGGADAAGGDRGVDKRWIVALSDGTDAGAEGRDIARSHGGQATLVFEHALNGFGFEGTDAEAARLARDPRVVSVVPDRVASIAAQTVPDGILRVDGELSTAAAGNGSGSVDVDVAVLDTGIDLDHPDLNVVGGRNCTTESSTDDGNGHGSHVAGTIAAKDDTNGVVGVAPGARLWAVKVLNSRGSGYWSWIICGIDWVAANAGTIEVANMSLGGSGSEDGCNDNSMQEAICNAVGKGVTFAVAAGNSAADASGFVPAAYDQVITVSSLADFDGEPGGLAPYQCSDYDDTLSYFSNYGADVDLIAPGSCVYSTYKNGSYKTLSGTSMASPHVAGAAALYLSANPGTSPANVKTALQAAGNLLWNDVDDPDGTQERLVNVASGSSTPTDNPPTVDLTSPTGGTVSGSVTVAATAGDDHGVASVAFYVDDVLKATDTSAPYEWSWDTTTATNAAHTVKAVASDTASPAQTATDSVSVTVDNAKSQPGAVSATLSPSSTSQGNQWTALVTITVSGTTDPVAVTGSWSNGTSGTASCTTSGGATNSCTVSKSGLAKRTSSVRFSLTNVNHSSWDGVTSSVTVTKP